MEGEIIEKYRDAGKVLKYVRDEAAKAIEVDASVLEVAEYAERLIIEKGAQPAFPCNISRNNEAAHVTPARDDKLKFGEDMVKLDIGAHIDGYIADSAVTVDLSGNEELVKASKDALDAAIVRCRDGVSTSEIGAIINEHIRAYGFRPIVNLTGHGLARYDHHTTPPIPNIGLRKGVTLREDMVLGIEPFATNGVGRISEREGGEIYVQIAERPVRLATARRLQEYIKRYNNLPFAKRWLPERGTRIALKHLESAKSIKNYSVLKEDGDGLISQAEHTVIVEKNGCEVTT